MSTSKLQRYTGKQLYKRFGKYGLVENTRPQWLVSSKGERLELDFFIDKLSIAVEVQGRQHIEFTSCLHATEYDFEEQLRRDKDKAQVCKQTGINLLYIWKRSDIEIVLAQIYETKDQILNNEKQDIDFFAAGPSTKIHNSLKMLRGIVNKFKRKGTISSHSKILLRQMFPALLRRIEKELYWEPTSDNRETLQDGQQLYEEYCL